MPLLEDVEIASTDFVRAIMRATTNFDPEQPALTGYFDIIDGFVDFAAGDASSIVGLQHSTHTPSGSSPPAPMPGLYLLALPMSAPISPRPARPIGRWASRLATTNRLGSAARAATAR